MNATHLHLALNHLPIVGAPLAALLLAWGLIRRSRDVLRAALGLTLLLGAATYPVFLTGKSAEHVVEEAAWATTTLIERHEQRGDAALVAMLATAGLAGAALWLLRGSAEPRRVMPSAVLVALVVSSGLLGWTGLSGGDIRHDEIRSSSVATGPHDAASNAHEEPSEHP